MTIVTDIIPEDINIDRELVLHRISTLANVSDLTSLDDAFHAHHIDEINRLGIELSNFANVSHTHQISDFSILSKITNNFSSYRHQHDGNSLELIQRELSDTQQKINLLQAAIQNSISIVEQLLNKNVKLL